MKSFLGNFYGHLAIFVWSHWKGQSRVMHHWSIFLQTKLIISKERHFVHTFLEGKSTRVKNLEGGFCWWRNLKMSNKITSQIYTQNNFKRNALNLFCSSLVKAILPCALLNLCSTATFKNLEGGFCWWSNLKMSNKITSQIYTRNKLPLKLFCSSLDKAILLPHLQPCLPCSREHSP